MQRSCGSCGASYEAERPSSKYCSGRCRKRAQRRPKGAPAPVVAARAVSATPAGLVGATRAELEAAGRLESVAGQAALVLAGRISSPSETGASVASMSRELRALMAAALEGVAVAADPVDELRQRRDRKRAG